METLNQQVRSFWEREPCGTFADAVGEVEANTREWFQRVEEYRYRLEPFIHEVAQFTHHRDKRVLEVGVGAGTDHLQFARAGANCWGVDLTQAAIETTRQHLAMHDLNSNLQRVDAESLPFDDDFFDVVYSWGVIHHTEDPDVMIAEIHRVLREGGQFIGMMYGRRSLVAFKAWIRHALLKGRPWRSFRDVIWNHVESVGTKAYTLKEFQKLFAGFRTFSAHPIVTEYDKLRLPAFLVGLYPASWGWFVALRAEK